MNRSLLPLVILSSFSCSTFYALDQKNNCSKAKINNSEVITLTSDVLKIIDGKSFGINGDDIVLLIRVRLDLRKRLLGSGLTALEQKACFYNNSFYTIKEMAVLEQKLRESGALQGDVYTNMGASLYATKSALLEEIAIPLLSKLRSAKKYTVLLIQESCEKHNRGNSILLEWAKTDEAHEIEAFMNKLDSFKTLGLFCLDIIHLIGDIIHSCPIAYQQFEEMKQSYYAAEGESFIDHVKAE